MGSYGIGISRLMATAVEIHHDDNGIIWPESLAPFRVHLLELGDVSAKDIYADLQKRNIEVLYDDREVSPGGKLVEADLLGIPFRAVISKKTGDKVEVKRRNEKEAKLMEKDEFISLITNN